MRIPVLLGLILAVQIPLSAQTFTTLHSFSNLDGQYPAAGLVLASNVLYGTTTHGGSGTNGTVFAMNIDGSNFRVLHNFSGTDPNTGTNWDGAIPVTELVLSGNTLYGTTLQGGSNSLYNSGCGTIFSLRTDGSCFKVLRAFDNWDGVAPHGQLLMLNGVLYGTTLSGGDLFLNRGTIYSVNADGTDFNEIHAFYDESDGQFPEGGLVSISNVLYGTTEYGGNDGIGTVYSTAFTTAYANLLHVFDEPPFDPSDGATPRRGLLYSGGKLFGMTYQGGSGDNGTIFSLNIDGSNYETLHNFTSDSTGNTNTDGAAPDCELFSCNNVIYGTTYLGGTQSNGVVFAMNEDGSNYVVLHSFSEVDPVTLTNPDGANSESSLVISGNTLYGTATIGGSQGQGTIFSLQLPSIVSLTHDREGNVTIQFAGGSDMNLVQATTNPAGAWQTISTNTAGTNGLWQFTDTNALEYPVRFYRSATP